MESSLPTDEPGADRGDEELMVAWQGGDAVAFDELVGRWHARLFGFCMRMTADRQQAEDAYSETLMRLVRSRDRYEPRQTFRSWLFTVARNCAHDTQRSRTRWLRLVRKAEAEPPSALGTPPDRQIQQSQRADRIDAALATLPETHRAATLLRYRYDLDHAEVAAALGLTERQVRDRLSYARRVLRDLLAEEGAP
jgi:RNA polymerase sigma-70 factor (ECF subfamily)